MDKDSRKRHLVVDDDFRYRSTGATVVFLKPTCGDIPEKRKPGVYLVGSEWGSPNGLCPQNWSYVQHILIY